eukprot:scaffold15235_cov73-Cyclotella_meneghiniana.AAC.1
MDSFPHASDPPFSVYSALPQRSRRRKLRHVGDTCLVSCLWGRTFVAELRTFDLLTLASSSSATDVLTSLTISPLFQQAMRNLNLDGFCVYDDKTIQDAAGHNNTNGLVT